MANNTLEDFLLRFCFFPNATQSGTVNPELERLRQKICAFEAHLNLNYVAGPHLKNAIISQSINKMK